MPNWCNSNIVIWGDTNSISKIVKMLQNENDAKAGALNGSDIDFNRILESPAIPNVVDWQINNWGCKWGPDSSEWEVFGNEITISFDTPWSPPCVLFQHLSDEVLKDNDAQLEITIRWLDIGLDQAGIIELSKNYIDTKQYSIYKNKELIVDYGLIGMIGYETEEI